MSAWFVGGRLLLVDENADLNGEVLYFQRIAQGI